MRTMYECLIFFSAVTGAGYLLFCVMLYLSQRSYLYYPTGRDESVLSIVLNRDNARIVVSVNNVDSDSAALYFGGNAEDVSRSVELLSRAFPQSKIYAMHYRGYGGSTGTPTEESLVGDGGALYEEIIRKHRHVTIIGRSLGSGIAMQVAAGRDIRRLVLVTPYYSIAELAADRFWLFPVTLILEDKYESWRYAGQVTAPTTIVLASDDDVIPADSSLRLASRFTLGRARLIRLASTNHYNIPENLQYPAVLNGSHAN